MSTTESHKDSDGVSGKSTLPYGVEDNSFQAAGGEQGILQLVQAFYRHMDELPEARGIRAMHSSDLALSIDKLACFLSGWLGGPRRYTEKYGSIAIPPAHAHLPITEVEKAAWLACMQAALEEQDYAPDFKTYMLTQLAVPAGRIVVLRENMGRVSR